MAAEHRSVLVAVGITAFVAWRIYKRIRRMVGRQRLSPVRSWFSLGFFSLIMLLLVAVSALHPLSLAALLGGAAIGVGLGAYGLSLTRFEQTPIGLFYTPNVHLGIALSLLLIARIVYRLAHAYVSTGDITPASADFGRSPLTLLVFAVLAGYYVVYAAGLLRWRRRVVGPSR